MGKVVTGRSPLFSGKDRDESKDLCQPEFLLWEGSQEGKVDKKYPFQYHGKKIKGIQDKVSI